MYYRRKVILALLEIFDNKLDKIAFQKLLFLFAQNQKKPSFDFIPYKQGCFSFQSYADMRTMMKYELIKEDRETWIKIDSKKYQSSLTLDDSLVLKNLQKQFPCASSEDLILYTYKKYPYYALNSLISKKILDQSGLERIERTIPQNNKKALYTIGYEGISLERYLNKLILNRIKILCDVRKNPLSMKYGFSKSQLQKACEGLDISYIHLPNLGINSDKRQNLITQADYDLLFDDYRTVTLAQNHSAMNNILDLLEKNSRVAITCFEANHCQCHRGTLANQMITLPKWEYEVIHL